jgi:PAS domain S-box-containing protein
VFLLGLTFTALVTLALHNYQAERLKVRFDNAVLGVVDDIQRRFRVPIFGLAGARGLYAASDEIRRDEFFRYVNSRNLDEEFPGVRGIGFIERVMRSDLEAFLRFERADGAPDFQIRSLSLAEQPDLYVIKYIEPLDRNRNALGLDVGSEPVRREAAERAAQTGQPALTGAIELVQDQLSRPGFLLYVPVYRPGLPLDTPEQRQAALRGLTYSPIVLEELLAPAKATLEGTGLRFHLLDKPSGEGGRTLLDLGKEHGSALLTSETVLNIGGTSLVLQAHSTPAFEALANRQLVFSLGASGVLLSGMVAWMLWLQATARARAESRARDMTADLQKLALLAQRTANSVLMTDAALRINWVNEGFTRMTGYTLEDAQGKTPGELLGSGKADPSTLERLRKSAEQGEACRVEILNRNKDGGEYWVDTEVQPFRDAAGQVTGFIEIGLDITKDRETNQRLVEAVLISEIKQQELDLLARVVRATSNAVVLTDTQGRIEWVNAGFTRLFEYPVEAVVGTRLGSKVRCAETDSAAAAEIDSALQAVRACEVEILNRSGQGRLIWVQVEVQPLFSAESEHTGFMTIESDISQRKAAETALRVSEQRFRELLDIAADWYWETDESYRFIRFHATHDAAYLAVTDAAMGKCRWEMPGVRPLSSDWPDHIAQHERREEFRNFEYERTFPNGDIRYYKISGFPVFDESGRFQGYRGTSRDSTEQMRQRVELQTARDRFELATESAGIGVWVFDIPGNTLHWDERMFRLYGRDPTDALGPLTLWTDSVHPDDLPMTAKALEDALAGRREFDVEFRVLWSDGTVHHLHGTGRVQRDGNGQPLRMIGVNIDVTEQIRRERQVAADEMRLRAIYEILPVGITLTDPQGHIVDCNPASERMLGISKEEHLNRDYDGKEWEIFREDGCPMPAQEFASVRALTLGTAVHDAVMQVVTDRNSVWLSVSAMPVLHEDFGVVIAYVDITQQKMQADALLAAKNLAEQASAFKSQFLANMSHEIRTPMNAILGMLKLLQNTPLQPRQVDYVGKTEQAAHSMLGLLNDILDFSRIEAGKMALDPQPFELEPVLQNIGIIFSASVGDKPVEVLFDIDPRIPRKLVGDSLRLQQVLINLGGNAIKFTPSGEVVLQMRLEGLEGEGPDQLAQVQIAVRDSGIGIAPENQERIFAGFTQAEASTTRRFGGSGLGLSICQRLVELMGSQLNLTSALGKGSTFSFNLRLPVIEGSPTPALTDGTASALRVLVVDDNPIAREVLVAMGRSLDWAVDTAADGESALELVHQQAQCGQAYQAVFMDWVMPGLDGWQTSAAIRAKTVDGPTTSPQPVIIMLTAHGREALAQQMQESRKLIDTYLVKPVTRSMLLEAVNRALSPIRSLAPEKERSNPTEAAQPLARMRLLVVEDNPINQEVAAALLSMQGATVDIAGNGRLGVDAVQNAANTGHPYQAVLMDMQMPVMDGLTATREIRRQLDASELPIIAMTANAMSADRETCLAAGMNDHIGKPFELEHLVATLLRWVRGTTGQPRLGNAEEATATSVDLAQSKDTPSLPVARTGNAPGQFPLVSGIDTEDAAARLNHQRDLFIRLLQLMAKDFADLLALPTDGDGLSHLVDPASRKAVAQRVHRLRGSAGSVGARGLLEAATAAERALLENSIDAVQRLIEMKQALGELVRGIHHMLDAEKNLPARVNAAGVNAHLDPAAVRELLHLLQTQDLMALDRYAEMQATLDVCMRPEDAQELAAAMQVLDFYRAAGALCKLESVAQA